MPNNLQPLTCAHDADWYQYDVVAKSDEASREGSEDPDYY